MAAAEHQVEHHTTTGIDSRKLLMWIFLGSECLFFGSLIATYLIFKGEIDLPPFPSETHVETAYLEEALASGEITEVHKHLCHESDEAGISVCEGIFDIPLTSQSTFVLLMSSVAMVLAVYGAQHNRPMMMKSWLLATMLLGVIFLGYQVYEFRTFGQEGLTLETSQFGASFFVLTGFHGTHVAVGVLILGSLLLASFRRRGLGSEPGFQVETAGLYWHFVDIVWIVIFTVLYLIPA
ncbi:MAG: heme-copper oxidase subunit III [Chloroflexota bacterium]|nr:heme-copper oxidase subunit III [Chloroflexota bacterium]MDE2696174.1 heme-copper oxidase subunit III [Chloroflexota bacterium]